MAGVIEVSPVATIAPGMAVALLHRILISLAYNNGLRESAKVKKAWGQHIVLVATLVHYAYALGIRRGRQEQLQSEEEGDEAG